MIITLQSGTDCRTVSIISSPSHLGIRMSVRMISGLVLKISWQPASPSNAVPATSQPSVSHLIVSTSERTVMGLSSMITTLSSMEPPPGTLIRQGTLGHCRKVGFLYYSIIAKKADRRQSAFLQLAYPFTAPDMIPATINRCVHRYRIRMGSIDSMKNANARFNSVIFSPK